MSPQEKLKEIETRCKDATKGPWNSAYHNRTDTYAVTWEMPGVDEFGDNFDTCNQKENIIAISLDGRGKREEDIDFIAHSRTDMEWLISRIHRLEKALDIISADLNSRHYVRARKALEGEE